MVSIDEIYTFCKRKGFVFPSSEIYGGLSGIFDYGPLGVELKNNIKKEWWNSMTRMREDIVGIDGSILAHPKVWESSGHVENFIDLMVECKKCKFRTKIDKGDLDKIKCEKCDSEYENKGEFNPMFSTNIGVTKEDYMETYLRPETAQMIYINFKNVVDTTRVKIPFGIAQIGKVFRNEISPRNFLFRMREFEQMEMQYFVKKNDAPKFFDEWKNERMNWYLNFGVNKNKLRFREHREDELAHYAKRAVDIEYEFDFGWKEIEGIHNRGDWDLSQHQKFSKKDLKYFDEETKEKFIPWVIETSPGLDRNFLLFVADAYTEEEVKGEKRIVLKLHPKLAPYKVAIFPLVKKDGLSEKAKEIYGSLKKDFRAFYDESGSIGRRYRRMDEIGTPLCVTIDYDTLKEDTITIRDRDTMEQKRIKIGDIKNIIGEKL